MKQEPSKVEDLSDRQLQEWIYRILSKQERHQKYFSSVLTAYLILTAVVALIAFLYLTS